MLIHLLADVVTGNFTTVTVMVLFLLILYACFVTTTAKQFAKKTTKCRLSP